MAEKLGNQKVGCLGAVVIIFVAVWVFGMLFDDGSTPAQRSTPSPSLSVGDDGRLVVSQGVIPVALTPDLYKRMQQLLLAEDFLGVGKMAVAGQVLSVESGTRCKVISKGFERTEVRIMEGPHFGRSGWVTSSLVQR